MIKDVLREIGGVGLYGVVSVLLFFSVFAGALVWTLLQRRSLCDSMGSLPLRNDGNDPALKGGQSHE